METFERSFAGNREGIEEEFMIDWKKHPPTETDPGAGMRMVCWTWHPWSRLPDQLQTQ